ncbi:hypothetical protein BN13_1130003 [Nostocoides jenkinsii Ben 74]|uniref:Uncharacterized protein n=1 Tax=Nostocoides jenkinsii Ben 74 TaxID=1193518 RepID=A0A077M781_9MICO|nr:hypothetical protein BN13_1130003 [Tetrasphaera jenkinsii Ben 74]
MTPHLPLHQMAPGGIVALGHDQLCGPVVAWGKNSGPVREGRGRREGPILIRPSARSGSPRGSDRTNAVSLRALGALGDLELDPLGLVEAAVASGVDRRVVNEDVGAAAVLSDEAEALLSVEPLNSALCHGVNLFLSCLRRESAIGRNPELLNCPLMLGRTPHTRESWPGEPAPGWTC